MSWTLHGRAIGRSYDDMATVPVMLPADSHCSTCGDEYNEREIHKGRCFLCRYGRYLTKGVALELRGF